MTFFGVTLLPLVATDIFCEVIVDILDLKFKLAPKPFEKSYPFRYWLQFVWAAKNLFPERPKGFHNVWNQILGAVTEFVGNDSPGLDQVKVLLGQIVECVKVDPFEPDVGDLVLGTDH